MPEVNRNKNIGEKGVNMNANTFKLYLAKMNWEDRGVEGFGDLAYLTAEAYNASMARLAAGAALWEGGTLKDAQFSPGQVHALPTQAAHFTAPCQMAKGNTCWQKLRAQCLCVWQHAARPDPCSGLARVTGTY